MFSNPADPLRARLADPQALAGLLPWVVESLSIARGQMLVDQVTKTVQSNDWNNLLIVIVEKAVANGSSSPHFVILQAAIAQINPSLANSNAGEMRHRTATVLYAGRAPRRGVGDPDLEELCQATSLLSSTLDTELSVRGVQFVQWPRDPSNATPMRIETAENVLRNDLDCDSLSFVEKRGDLSSVGRDSWPELLGFQSLATLCYMRCDLKEASGGGQVRHPQDCLQMVPVSHAMTERPRFESLVERTYVHTLDCPLLSQFQTTAATLDGYRASPVFSPDLWFEAELVPATTVGCLVLARHGKRYLDDRESSACETASESVQVAASCRVLEVVYMGVVPEHRGRGFGAQLVRHTIELAREAGCESVILAVDSKNSPARASYEAAGFVPVLLEEVWGRSCGGQN